MLSTKFQISWPLGSEEEAKNRFSRWRPSWISIRTILAIVDQQFFPMLPAEFQVNWPLGSGEAKTIFSEVPPQRPSLISSRNDFSYFFSTSHPDAFYQVSSRMAF